MSAAAAQRRYRRLLWAYPGPYRRRHGAEIVTTLLEMAESGPDRPGLGETLHLVACGVRQRLRLPAGRPLAVLAAVAAAIALGALGAAGGTWLGWQTAASVPDRAEMRALTAAIAGCSPSDVPVYPWQTAMNGPAVTTRATVASDYSAERARTALTSAGWHLTEFSETTGGLVVDLTSRPMAQIPARFLRFAATRDGLTLTGDTMTAAGDAGYGVGKQLDQRLDVSADETAAVRPLTIAGLLLGLLAGWLLTAALAYRIRLGGRSQRRAAVVLGLTALAAAVVPAFVLSCKLYQVLTYDSGASNQYIEAGPSDRIPAGLVTECGIVGVLALAAMIVIAARGARTGADPTGPDPAGGESSGPEPLAST